MNNISEGIVWSPEDIEAFESKHSVLCTLRDDSMFDVKGDIDINSRGLKDLSSIPPIHTLKGCFWCNGNYLVDLEGTPRIITEHFGCSHNSLETLEGAPIFVGMEFACHNNPDLQFTQSQLDDMNIKGPVLYDHEQLVPEDPREYIESGLLPI